MGPGSEPDLFAPVSGAAHAEGLAAAVRVSTLPAPGRAGDGPVFGEGGIIERAPIEPVLQAVERGLVGGTSDRADRSGGEFAGRLPDGQGSQPRGVPFEFGSLRGPGPPIICDKGFCRTIVPSSHPSFQTGIHRTVSEVCARCGRWPQFPPAR